MKKINENTKVTLTFAQLKRLVKEGDEWSTPNSNFRCCWCGLPVDMDTAHNVGHDIYCDDCFRERFYNDREDESGKVNSDSSFAKDKKSLRSQKDILWKQAWDYMVKALEIQSGNPVGLHDEDGLSDRLLVDVCDYGDDPGHIEEIADNYEKRVSDIVLAVDVWYEPDRKSRKDMRVDIAGICRNFIKRYRFRKMFASLDVDVYQMNKFGCSIFFYKK